MIPPLQQLFLECYFSTKEYRVILSDAPRGFSMIVRCAGFDFRMMNTRHVLAVVVMLGVICPGSATASGMPV